VSKVWFDPDLDRWLAPFVMASVNTRVVRRSQALFAREGRGYGPEFQYHEWLDAGSRRKAWAAAGLLVSANVLLASRFGRSIARRFGPAPGQGPSDSALAAGFCRTRFVGRSVSGKLALGHMEYAGDAGNRTTTLMLCTAGLLLATEADTLPARAGVLTPATCFEGRLLDALRDAGMRWDVRAA